MECNTKLKKIKLEEKYCIQPNQKEKKRNIANRCIKETHTQT